MRKITAKIPNLIEKSVASIIPQKLGSLTNLKKQIRYHQKAAKIRSW